MADLKITVRPNGPYVIRGPVHLVDANEEPYPDQGEVTALCRCGRSQNKPFCDGSHRVVGFQAPSAAPATES